MIPFMEEILVGYLGQVPAVTAIAGERIATKPPRSTKEAWIRITVLDDPPAGRSSADHLIEFYAQIDCFAGQEGDETTSSTLARTVRAALKEIADAAFDKAVVTGARVEGSRNLPDESMSPPIDRHIVTATIWAHSKE